MIWEKIIQGFEDSRGQGFKRLKNHKPETINREPDLKIWN